MNISRPWKKTWFFMAKTVGAFSQNCDFPWFLSWTQKPWKRRGNFTKSVIYRDQKSKKLPNDRHNERVVVRILIENGSEISDNICIGMALRPIFLDGCFKLTRLSLWTVFSTWNTTCWFLCLFGKKPNTVKSRHTFRKPWDHLKPVNHAMKTMITVFSGP